MYKPLQKEYDYIIIGSGFGGSVSALRLAQKGYSVLVIEKGKWFKSDDFAKTNWDLKRWLWLPSLKFFGIQKLTLFRHLTVLSGVGVGGGSLVYGNTLPKPKEKFFNHGSWATLNSWQKELDPFYDIAYKMLGATTNPYLGEADKQFKKLADNRGIKDSFHPTKVAVYFGKKGQEVEDPYFEGKGPTRTGCIHCGACMTGCRFNAKNTLDKNYLHLAQQLGVEILAENEVIDITHNDGQYTVAYKSSTKYFSKTFNVQSKGIVFSGGVLGTVPLLLKLKKSSLPMLSDQVGKDIRSNNEALIGTVSTNKSIDLTDGVAIGSIVDIDEDTHIEPVRYGHGSSFWKVLMAPMISDKNVFVRLFKLILFPLLHPLQTYHILFTKDFAKQTSIILFMQSIDSTLQFTSSFWGGVKSRVQKGKAPTAFIPIAHEIANEYADQLKGKSMVLATETITGIPSTAHILGGAVMGESKETGVIDKDNKVFGYPNMYVCDGSMISANPGVNPSLTITAISERAMSLVLASGQSD